MKAKTLKQNKVNIITLGCSKNLVDSEMLSGQLAANDIYTSRKNSLNLFVSDTSHSIVCIEGELNRKNEIFVIDSFLNSKRYFISKRIIRSGNNCKIEIKTK